MKVFPCTLAKKLLKTAALTDTSPAKVTQTLMENQVKGEAVVRKSGDSERVELKKKRTTAVCFGDTGQQEEERRQHSSNLC